VRWTSIALEGEGCEKIEGEVLKGVDEAWECLSKCPYSMRRPL
jgi:hypothetical protein